MKKFFKEIKSVLILYNKNLRVIFILFLIFSTFLFTRLYNIEYRFGFDFDQEQAANAAWKTIYNKRPPLIGQEASIGGLYVGPFLFWVQAFVMFLGKFNPLSLSYLGIVFSFFSLLLLYSLTRELFGKKVAILAAILYLFSPKLIPFDISGNAISYFLFFSISILWIQKKIFIDKKKVLLPILALLLGLVFHVHFALAFLVPTTLIFIIVYKMQFSNKQYLVSGLFFLLPFSTFLAFDIRHDFLISRNLYQILLSKGGISFDQVINAMRTQMSLMVDAAFFRTEFYLLFFTLVVVFFAFKMVSVQKRNLLIFLMVSFFLPQFFFWFYKGHKTEYYFLPTVPVFLIWAAYFFANLSRWNKLITHTLLVLLFVFSSYRLSQLFYNPLSYGEKKRIVEQVIDDSRNTTFNVYYHMHPGLDTGYRYLFKWKKMEPEENGENLYILEHRSPGKFDISYYYETFPGKDINVWLIQGVYIISVKEKRN